MNFHYTHTEINADNWNTNDFVWILTILVGTY